LGLEEHAVEVQTQGHQVVPVGDARRSFLGVLLGVASACIGALLGVPVVRYICSPLTAKSDDSGWADAGSVTLFSKIATPMRRVLDLEQRDGWQETASQPVVYIVQAGGQLKALSAICPHLGCTVPWDAGRQEFVCPCHGGVFSPDGTRLSGPPPRSLDALGTKVVGDRLLVNYQYFRPDVPNKQAIS
jgi:menaquinol-cytochrome c reductase iron-sulfur subunit